MLKSMIGFILGTALTLTLSAKTKDPYKYENDFKMIRAKAKGSLLSEDEIIAIEARHVLKDIPVPAPKDDYQINAVNGEIIAPLSEEEIKDIDEELHRKLAGGSFTNDEKIEISMAKILEKTFRKSQPRWLGPGSCVARHKKSWIAFTSKGSTNMSVIAAYASVLNECALWSKQHRKRVCDCVISCSPNIIPEANWPTVMNYLVSESFSYMNKCLKK